MITLDIKKLEKQLGKTIRRNCLSVGFDLASTTGIAIIKTTTKTMQLQTLIYKIPPSAKDEDKSEKYSEKLERLLMWIRDFKQTFKKEENSILVLEQSFLGYFFNKGQAFANAQTFGILRAMQGIVFSEMYDLFPRFSIVLATTARKDVGFKSNLPKKSTREQKKKEILMWINALLKTKLKDDNESDAVILAIRGLLE